MEQAKNHLALYQQNRLNKPFIDDPLLENVYRLKTGKILARDHVRKGIELGRMDRIPEAIEEFTQALELDPENTSVFIDLMILYGRSKQYEKAQKLYSGAPEKVRESSELHYNYGVILIEAQQFQDAAKAFQEVIRINPNDARAYNNIGQMLEKEGKFLDALDQYESSLKVDSQFRPARFNRARILIGQSKFTEAITELKQLLSPEDEATAQYSFVLSIAYVRSGDLENGVKYAEEALELARKYNQSDLARSIEDNLANLKKVTGNS
jgi:tetratricopeptide (TPR) repeat protein